MAEHRSRAKRTRYRADILIRQKATHRTDIWRARVSVAMPPREGYPERRKSPGWKSTPAKKLQEDRQLAAGRDGDAFRPYLVGLKGP